MTAAGSRARLLLTQLKQAAVFIAIVWAVAASFIAFELVSMKGLDIALSYPDLFGNLLLSRATKQSKACVVQPGEKATGATSHLSPAEARWASWLLGLQLGRDANARQSSAVNPQALAELAKSRERVAGMLGVHPPSVFVPQQFANANTEFARFVESDEGTAHQLAVKYSPEVCRIYKLAAFWGYATLVRVALPGKRGIFAFEIHHYARQSDLPEHLWRPMTKRTPRNATSEQIWAETMALTEGVGKHLAGAP